MINWWNFVLLIVSIFFSRRTTSPSRLYQK